MSTPVYFTLLLSFFSLSLLGQITDDFEDGTLNGWFSEGDGTSSVTQEIDDPNYSLKIEDNVTGDLNFAIAPARYLGDWSAGTNDDTLALDIYVQTGTNTLNFDAPIFEISGPGGRATAQSGIFLEGNVWHRRAVSLNPDDWTLEEGDWQDLLANVSLLRLLAEYRNGAESVFFDNVSLSLSPVRSTFTGAVCSTFEDGTVEGWRLVNNGSARVDSLDGNPGRGLGLADRSGVTGEAIAPPKFWGDWRVLQDSGYLQFDLRITNSNGPSFDKDYFVRISSATASAYALPSDSVLNLAIGDWHTFRFYIAEDDWTVTEGSWEELLSSVEEIRVQNEFIDGSEFTSLDNVCLSPAEQSVSSRDDFRDDRIRVFPNPSAGPLRITSPEHRILSVTLLDFTGRELLRQSVDALEYTLETTYRGPAVVRIATPEGPVYRRVMLR